MAYTEIRGNIFSTKAQALGNAVNCVGVMGKGIALEFRRRFPQMFTAYEADCKAQKLKPGRIYYYPTPKQLILNITTKNHWKYPSKLEWVESALKQLVDEYKQKQIKSLALPLLGAQSGKLETAEVKRLMRAYLQNLSDIEIEVYEFDSRAGDPLFDKLSALVHAPDPELHLQLAGIQSGKVSHIIDAVSNKRITSLSMLEDSGFLGEKSMDNLYSYLLQRGDQDEEPKQLSLFE